MKVLFAGQVPKHPSFPEENEDAFELAANIGRIALSDGASESFDSRSWARLLVSRFVQEPALTKDWLASLISEYGSLFEYSTMTWSKQAAFDRGSFATLLCIETCATYGTLDVLSVGDSLAVLLDGTDFVESYPYTRAEEFQQRPELFCTNATHNNFFMASDFFSQHLKTWRIAGRNAPSILCMTDALGEWALRNAQEGKSSWQVLSSIENITQLEALVFAERENKNMRIDDATLVRLSFDGVVENELPNS